MNPWKREEIIGDCRLLLGDCLEIMPTLPKVDAVDCADAVVYTEKHDKSAKRQRCSPEESGTDLGAAQGANNGSLCQRGYVPRGNGSGFRCISAGLSAGDNQNGNPIEGSGPSGEAERAICGRDTINGLPTDGCEGQMQSLRLDRSFSDPSQGPRPHEQHAGKSRSSLLSMPQQPSQARVVGLPEGFGVLTDPPYGIGEHGGAQRSRGKRGYAKHENLGWDKSRPNKLVFDWIKTAPCGSIVWGGNYFADWLPPKMGWLYWRKLMGGDFSDGELAWTSREAALREFVKCPKGMDKGHPCEKPVSLMEWCLGFLPDAQTILDPFMGSGTTLVACAKLGRRGIGIELEEKYFDIACRRVEDAYKQPDLFIAPPEKPKQEAMI